MKTSRAAKFRSVPMPIFSEDNRFYGYLGSVICWIAVKRSTIQAEKGGVLAALKKISLSVTPILLVLQFVPMN